MERDHADQVITLLGQMLDELQSIRLELSALTAGRSMTLDALAEQITGPAGSTLGDLRRHLVDVGEVITGPLAYNLGDVRQQLVEMSGTLGIIEVNTGLQFARGSFGLYSTDFQINTLRL